MEFQKTAVGVEVAKGEGGEERESIAAPGTTDAAVAAAAADPIKQAG